jgi:hypothetical protein
MADNVSRFDWYPNNIYPASSGQFSDPMSLESLKHRRSQLTLARSVETVSRRRMDTSRMQIIRGSLTMPLSDFEDVFGRPGKTLQ